MHSMDRRNSQTLSITAVYTVYTMNTQLQNLKNFWLGGTVPSPDAPSIHTPLGLGPPLQNSEYATEYTWQLSFD